MARKAPKRSRSDSPQAVAEHTANDSSVISSPSSQAVIGDRYRLSGTYERLRRTLYELPDDGRLDRTLLYWVLPTDRRLPIALLDQKLRDLLEIPFEALLQTPGIGQKKINGFFDLLQRAIEASDATNTFGWNSSTSMRYIDSPHEGISPKGRKQVVTEETTFDFDPGLVSEERWSTWRETVRRVGMNQQKLGRIAPTLQNLPKVIWNKRMADYSDMPLSKIRRLKTHGEKRVNAIMEIFHVVHESVSTSVLHEQLDLVLVPRFISQVTAWLLEANNDPSLVTEASAREHLVRPLIEQIVVDLGAPLAELVGSRLALEGEASSVKEQAAQLKVTRARVYQLLEDCAQAMQVRWPEGRWLMMPIGASNDSVDPKVQSLFRTTHALFYPATSSLEKET